MCRGTPNSAFSTTAIKDGHQGTLPRGNDRATSPTSDSSMNTLDAERADRISRLAGLERVATLRGANQHVAQGSQQSQQQQPLGYFDNASNLHKSTVGSASATGSAGGRTTWANDSSFDEADKMSEDQDDGISSAGLSDEGNASLVGFGEGASSTVSGPTSTSGRVGLGGKDNGGVGSQPSTRKHRRDSGSPMQGIED
ncbi:hypothetical protein MMC28_008323 [Mycoblastus sanguinarius]|nr:hypothetical protein [Mycoblastus sanguinarius]